MVSTISIMDTIIQPIIPPSKRIYRQHTVAFKRAVVEQSLAPGASVSRIARVHNVNANQVFAWRKLFKERRLGNAGDEFKLLPVALTQSPTEARPIRNEGSAAVPNGVIQLTVGKAQLHVEGHVNAAALSLVLEHLLR
jgi:transposase